MRRLRFRTVGWLLITALISLWSFGCGGHAPAGTSPYVAHITLSPGGPSSLQLGSTISFVAAAQNSAGTNIGGTFTYVSSNTSVVNVSPTGVACAGIWNTTFTICTAGGTGVAEVTAMIQGQRSAPTYVFVHPVIDNIEVLGVLLNGENIQEPCLPEGQTMTLEARAFSQGNDITQSVGPFTWTANYPSVVSITPITNNFYDFPTNQATATANMPGFTQIYASASGVASTTFQQPSEVPVVFDFFETCPFQSIVLELGHAGSGQTTFSAAKGNAQTVVATVTDVLGNSSLPGAGNGVTLNRIPLTWTATQPGSVAVSTGCSQSCTVTTPSAGAGAVSASCSPPTCNVGYPLVPSALATPAALQACQLALQSLFPAITSCEPFIPKPVYPTTAISGLVTGGGTSATTSAATLATSLECALDSPASCNTGIYSFNTAKGVPGGATVMPTSPNSLMFDLAGDRVYMGSNFGAQLINPSNFGTATSPFTSLGSVTGRILAISNNGTSAIFADTVHETNVVYVVNTTNASSITAVPLYISGAGAAAFSPDGLKAFIFGFDANGNPNLYVYSTLQALQVIPLAVGTSVNAITFSTDGAFVYVVSPSIAGGGPAFSIYNTCDNQPASDPLVALATPPIAFRALPDGVHFIALENDGNLEVFAATVKNAVPVATPTSYALSLCPLSVTLANVRTINLGQGTIQPVNFFVSPDGSLIYVVASDRNSILVYNFNTGAVSGIQLAGTTNPTPITADISIDGTVLLVAASDGFLHQINTGFGGSDTMQITFPNLPNYQNPFCTTTPAPGPCILNFVAAKP